MDGAPLIKPALELSRLVEQVGWQAARHPLQAFQAQPELAVDILGQVGGGGQLLL